MKNTRKILFGMVAAAGLAAATAIAYGQAAEFGPGMMRGGWGSGPMGPGMMRGGWGGGPMGPGMMRGGWGGGPMGPGMMGGGPRGGFGPGTAAAPGDPAAHMEARLAFLKTELKITSDQEAAWQAYATQAKQQAESMKALRARLPAAAQSTPEVLDQRAEFAKQRAEHMKALSAATKDLYTVLTPEQKALADQYFGGMHMSRFNARGRGR